MTTEDDFQRHLDAHPDDHHTRLVLADFLQERGDARAEGYRALGMLRKQPGEKEYTSWLCDWAGDAYWSECADALPEDWHRLFHKHARQSYVGHRYANRRDAEDAAALAFAQLPAARRAELLNQPATA